jgi:hypothetical protein
MQTIQAPSFGRSVQVNAADSLATENFVANLAAIAINQTGLFLEAMPLPDQISWLFARDGSLTAMLPGDRWWAGCSVPRRAAEFMLRTMDVGGVVACFLAPPYSAQIRVALDNLDSHQAVLAIVPQQSTLAVLLHCEDFSADIAAKRLWFVAGEQWESQLERLFAENHGLPTPSQFIRPISTNAEAGDRLIGPTQRIFVETNARRTALLQATYGDWRPKKTAERLCVISPSRFRLWADSGEALSSLVFETGIETKRMDPDHPAAASPLALALAARECDAIIAADLYRSYAQGAIPAELPWITWVTTPNIPPAATAGPRDHLLIVDPDWKAFAERAGWTSKQIHPARWPQMKLDAGNATISAGLTLIADTLSLEVPESVAEYSSQRLLWEYIRDELAHDPFVLGEDIERYLAARRARFQVGEDGFTPGLFVDRLIVSAYQQGIARLLLREGLPIRVFGKGWHGIEEFTPVARGAVGSRSQLQQIVAESPALIHVWPSRHVRPIEATGIPVVRAMGNRRKTFLSEAWAALRGAIPRGQEPAEQIISARLILNLIASL